jgi:2-polyprenyl-3-methyl-5-hydroxy-6-metoxy-1,4-benzoquinol methylase
MSSIKYYDKNVNAFYERTIHADVFNLYQKFLPHINKRAKILDAGCGIGRDAKYFHNLGYDITAFDGSIEMVKKASIELRKEVFHFTFQDLNFIDEFDAIWANESLLHVPNEKNNVNQL